MSILIKGMGLPRNCEVCPLNFYECALLEKSSEEIMQYFGGDCRHPDCPLLEAQERKRGKWIVMNDEYVDACKCSECGCIEYFNKGWKRFNFCPNCGAEIEEEK